MIHLLALRAIQHVFSGQSLDVRSERQVVVSVSRHEEKRWLQFHGWGGISGLVMGSLGRFVVWRICKTVQGTCLLTDEGLCGWAANDTADDSQRVIMETECGRMMLRVFSRKSPVLW